MAKKKEISKPREKTNKNVKKQHIQHTSEDLYVSMQDPNEKRKNLLLAIKNSLIMQEEHDKILEIRREKQSLLSEIKQDMLLLSKTYQKLKTVVPNVKNIIPDTEKEINVLRSQMRSLKNNIYTDKEKIIERENIEKKLETPDIKTISDIENKLKISEKKSMTKMDRIKNNLKVIESKLSNL
jgi:predicted secreted protein